MKNRIISFILMLAILFSCLSLEIFATQSGDSSTEAVTGTHLDYGVGRYIAALIFFAALTGEDISKVEWSPTNVGNDVDDVDAAARAVAIESVINALKNPYEVTQSVYTSAQ